MSTANTVLKVLDLVVAGTLAAERMIELRARIQAMAAEGRDPTDAEWDRLFGDIAADSARLDAADKRLNEQ